MSEDKPKRPAQPRAETMQRFETDMRSYHYLPDYQRSVLAKDAAEAVDRAKRGDWDEEVTEDQVNG